MNSLNLIIVELPSTARFPLYDVQGNYFTGNTLTHFSGPVNIISRTILDPSTLSSEPILVYTQNGWVILVSRNNTAVVVASSPPQAINQPTENVISLIVPNISNISTSNVERLERIQLPPFNPDLLLQIENIVRQHSPLYITSWMRNNEIPSMGEYYPNLSGLNIISNQPAHMVSGVMPIEQSIDTREWVRPPQIEQEIRNQNQRSSTEEVLNQTNIRNDETKQSYETLLKQLYGIPVQLPESLVINGLKVNFVPFEQIGPSFWSLTKMRAFSEPD